VCTIPGVKTTAGTPRRRRDPGAPAVGPPAAALAVIDRFIDALWIEDGLAPLTLAAYRRDLALLAGWLHAERGVGLEAAGETDLRGYIGARHAGSRASSANRRLTVFKRFYRWALREHLLSADPTLKLLAARSRCACPRRCPRRRWRRCWPRPTPPRRWACATARCSS
jgi:integrase/recombinase XerD